jgi:hypothetical protein
MSRGEAIELAICCVDEAEIQQIAAFLTDVHEGLSERDGEVTMRQQLNELYRVIERLMEAAIEAVP